MFEKISQFKKNIKEKVILTTKVLIILALLTTLSKEMKAAPETTEEGDDLKNKIELANLSLTKIKAELEKDNSVRSLGNTSIQSCKIGTAEAVQAKDGKWFLLTTKDGSRVFYDLEGDGSIDRMVVNERPEEGTHTLVVNGLYVFPGIDDLAEQAEVVGSLKPEKVTVFNVNEDGTVSIVDYTDGTSGTLNAEDSNSALNQMQEVYTNNLQIIAESINK